MALGNLQQDEPCLELEIYNGYQSFFTPEMDPEDTQFMYATKEDEAWQSDKMTPKVPPGYDGTTSFFAYEEAVQEWLSICVIEDHRKVPVLRHRLRGHALTVKKLLDPQ